MQQVRILIEAIHSLQWIAEQQQQQPSVEEPALQTVPSRHTAAMPLINSLHHSIDLLGTHTVPIHNLLSTHIMLNVNLLGTPIMPILKNGGLLSSTNFKKGEEASFPFKLIKKRLYSKVFLAS